MTDPAHAAPSRPEPVTRAANQAGAIAALIGAVATALGTYGVTTGQIWAQASGAIVAAIATGLAGMLPRITAEGARAQVTPLASPQAVDGAPLVPLAVVRPPADTSALMGPDL